MSTKVSDNIAINQSRKHIIKTVSRFAILVLGIFVLSGCFPQVSSNNSQNLSRFAVGQYIGNWEMTSPRTEQSTATLTINQASNGSLFGILTDATNVRPTIQLICNPLQNTQLSCFLTSQGSTTSMTMSGNVGDSGFTGLWLARDTEGEKEGIFNFQRVVR